MKQFDINTYMAEVNRDFSGMNGEIQDNFISSQDEGMSYSFSPAPTAMKAAAPVQVTVSNTTGGTLNVVLFGYNIYSQIANGGSDTGVTVSCPNSVSYAQLSAASATQPFTTAQLRLNISGTNAATQISVPLLINSRSVTGQYVGVPIITSGDFSPMQFQGSILDITQQISIDGDSWISFQLYAGTTVSLTFWNAAKVAPSNSLKGAAQLHNYAAPNVAIASVPVYVAPRALGAGA